MRQRIGPCLARNRIDPKTGRIGETHPVAATGPIRRLDLRCARHAGERLQIGSTVDPQAEADEASLRRVAT